MKTVWYLVDNNVLSQLTSAQRSSAFMREHCRIPTEVLHEARGFPDIKTLRELESPTTADVLKHVREVMATVPPGDFKLVDLYRNKGNADPLILATALTAIHKADETLFGEDWQVVTDDVAVRAKATEVGVTSLGSNDFVALLGAVEPTPE